MNIQEKRIGPGIPVLELVGSITMGIECERLQQEIERLVRGSETKVVLDLSALQHIDSAGVGRIVSCLTKLRRAGGDLRVAGAQGMVADVLRMTRIDQVMRVFPTAVAAADSFAPPNPPAGMPTGQGR